MADQHLNGSLLILGRASGTQEAQSCLGVSFTEPTSQSSSRLQKNPQPVQGTAWHSWPATPPQEHSSAGRRRRRRRSQLIDGAGGDVLSFGTLVTWQVPPGATLAGAAPPLTPELTPSRKRLLSPPSAPRPAKRRRSQTQNDLYRPDEDVQRLASTHALRNARELTISLAETAGCAVGKEKAAREIHGRQVNDAGGTTTWPQEGHNHHISISQDQACIGLNLETEQQLTRNHKPRYAIEIEYLSEDEIEQQLAQLLSAYRAFYLEPDEREPPAQAPTDTAGARASRRLLKEVFGDRLSSAEDEELLMLREEEDVLDMLLGWVRETTQMMPAGSCGCCCRRETFDELDGCVDRLGSLGGGGFVESVRLSVETRDGSVFMARLPGKGLNGVQEWDLSEVRDVFCELDDIDGVSESEI
ncbi:hypothetical protein N658DRAFT_138024 [Parathielavia hyrcaniae]|uniref:Uncharacterized protein n=1 Tax=Parathielavia hyrcaniae TaxID=113614 RepID=A0AAN6QAH3_9PEZI|nr:hypothetical protein N658DRAFT_138024 [Parathielavia hyrcaniae]